MSDFHTALSRTMKEQHQERATLEAERAREDTQNAYDMEVKLMYLEDEFRQLQEEYQQERDEIKEQHYRRGGQYRVERLEKDEEIAEAHDRELKKLVQVFTSGGVVTRGAAAGRNKRQLKVEKAAKVDDDETTDDGYFPKTPTRKSKKKKTSVTPAFKVDPATLHGFAKKRYLNQEENFAQINKVVADAALATPPKSDKKSAVAEVKTTAFSPGFTKPFTPAQRARTYQLLENDGIIKEDQGEKEFVKQHRHGFIHSF